MSHTVFLAFGSNLGNRKENLSRALELLKHEGLKPVSVSLPVITATHRAHARKDAEIA